MLCVGRATRFKLRELSSGVTAIWIHLQVRRPAILDEDYTQKEPDSQIHDGVNDYKSEGHREHRKRPFDADESVRAPMHPMVHLAFI